MPVSVSPKSPLFRNPLPSHLPQEAMDLRLPAVNSTYFLLCPENPEAGIKAAPRLRVWRPLPGGCLRWHIQLPISPASAPSNPFLAGGCLRDMASVLLSVQPSTNRFSFSIVAASGTDFVDPSKHPQTTSLS